MRYAAAFLSSANEYALDDEGIRYSHIGRSLKDKFREIAYFGFFHFELLSECICCLLARCDDCFAFGKLPQ